MHQIAISRVWGVWLKSSRTPSAIIQNVSPNYWQVCNCRQYMDYSRRSLKGISVKDTSGLFHWKYVTLAKVVFMESYFLSTSRWNKLTFSTTLFI